MARGLGEVALYAAEAAVSTASGGYEALGGERGCLGCSPGRGGAPGVGWCQGVVCASGDRACSGGGVGMLDRLRARRFLAALLSVSGLGLVGRWSWTTGNLLDMVRETGEGGCCECMVGQRERARHGSAVQLGVREEAGVGLVRLEGDKDDQSTLQLLDKINPKQY